MAPTRKQMAQRMARGLKDGYYVSLGVGIPTLTADYALEGIDVILQSENDLLGMSAFPSEVEVGADMISAGKQTVTARAGAPIFGSAQLFAMIRGGHVDLTALGALEADVCGNIAPWMIPGKPVKGMGGAMDLAAGAENIIITMTHVSKDGESKLLLYCTLSPTGCGCIRKVLTDLAYLEIEDGAFTLRERAPGVSVEEIVAKVAGKLVVPEHVSEMSFRIAARTAGASTQGVDRADCPSQRA